MSIRSGATRRYTPLFQRVAATNAIVLVSACVVTILVVSPHKLSSFAADEAVVLLAALIVVVAINLYCCAARSRRCEALDGGGAEDRPARPGHRVPVSDYESEATELADDLQRDARAPRERAPRQRRAARSPRRRRERLRIAQELHDEVGQTLTGVLLQLGRAARAPAPSWPSELRGGAGDGARDAWRRCGGSRAELRPEALDDLGLAQRAAALGERVAEQHRAARSTRRVDRGLPELGGEAELVIYRVAQEALTNVARHAGSEPRRGLARAWRLGG